MIEWRRGRDNHGRIHTFAMDETECTHYLPDEGQYTRTFRYTATSRTPRQGDFDGSEVFEECTRDIRRRFPREAFESCCKRYGIVEHAPSKWAPGDFCWRVWRPHEYPDAELSVGLQLARARAVRYSRILCDRLRDVFRFVEPAAAHAHVYGHEIRQLLLLACTEVESSWRAVLSFNSSDGEPKRYTTNEYVRLLPVMRLSDWGVELSAHRDFGVLRPFRDWSASAPTTSLPWYDAYNVTKHDREGALERATLRHVVDAMAAVFVMTLAQFGESHMDSGEFHPDEFHAVERPEFPLDELYIRPLALPGSDAPGTWMPRSCDGLAH